MTTAPPLIGSVAKLADFLPTAETRAAWLAVTDFAECLTTREMPECNPLVLHGPPGTGKSHLAWGLLAAAPSEITPAGDLGRGDPSAAVKAADLWVVDDLHRLPDRGVEIFGRLLDYRLARRKAVCVTTNVSPSRLALPARLISRLTGGLVIALELPSLESRRELLDHFTRDRAWQLAPDAAAWIADRATGVRPLLGAAQRLDALVKSLGRSTIELADVRATFTDDASPPEAERILRVVADQFDVEAKHLRSPSRKPALAWPTQLAMALVRQATGLSAEQVGAFFGGRDASTVRHAARVVARKVEGDPVAAADWRRLVAHTSPSTGTGVGR